MKKIITMSICLMFILVSTALKDDLHLTENDAQLSSGNGHDALMFQAKGQIITTHAEGALADTDSLYVMDTVMDSEGNTYVAMVSGDQTAIFDDVAQVNLITEFDRMLGIPSSYSSIFGKMDPHGNWLWIQYPEIGNPEDCEYPYYQNTNYSGLYSQDIELSLDGSELRITGQYNGCILFDSGDYLVTNASFAFSAFLLSIDTENGEYVWATSLNQEYVSNPTVAAPILGESIAYDSESDRIYVGGSIAGLSQDFTSFGPTSPLYGDDNGDALLMVFDGEGNLLHFEDSCKLNDDIVDYSNGYASIPDSYESCNGGGKESVVEVQVHDGQLVLLVEVESMNPDSTATGEDVSIFESENITLEPHQKHLIRVNKNLETYQNIGIPTEIGTGEDSDHFVDAVVLGNEMHVLYSNNESINSVNLDTSELTTYSSPTGALPSAKGYIHGKYLDLNVLLYSRTNLDIELSNQNVQSVEIEAGYSFIGTMNSHVFHLTDHSLFALNMGPQLMGYEIANGPYHSSIFGVSSESPKFFYGEIFAHDSDSDQVPDYLDMNPNLGSNDDYDSDGILDDVDNCVTIWNANQSDTDQDGIGDVCDDVSNDIDGDGVLDRTDNCIYVQNPNQANMDDDAQGDACDGDIDGDNVPNVAPIHYSNGTSQDLCPYVDATGKDNNQDGCIDEAEPVDCPVCEDPIPKNETTPLLDPEDVETVVVVGGTGAVGGGILAIVLSKIRRASRFIGVDDGLEVLKHLPKRKKVDAGSDHYFRRGLVRQREMTLSADKNLDDYIEENDIEGSETNE